MQGALGSRQSVQVGDKIRKAIDSEMTPGVERCPMDVLAQQGNPGQPPAGGNETPQAPIGRDKQGDPQLRMPLEQPLNIAERTASQVTAGIEFVPGCGRVDVI